MKIISVVWDEEDDYLAVNHEGCNRFEAVGMLWEALDLISGLGEAEEVTEDGTGPD